MRKYERVREVLVYENRRVAVFDDAIRRPDGESDTYFRVQYKSGTGGAVIVPELPDGRLLLLEVRRYAFDEDSVEFPRGGAEPNEATEVTAARELFAETSLRPSRLIVMGHCRPDTSIIRVDATVYLAELTASAEREVKVDQNEAIHNYSWLSCDEISRKAAFGAIRDGFTLSAFSLYSAYLVRR